jgi:NAD(P)-dependent dehydrogenase (short-subunit alcohol dehydrogenase family)
LHVLNPFSRENDEGNIMNTMQDKVALVTGGTSGIGRATAIAFAKQGAKVVIAGRRQHEGEETLQMVKAAGSDGLFIRADVSDETQVKDIVDKTVAKYGRLDYAFNNAGTEGQPGPFTEQTVANYDQIMDINVKGLFLSMKHEIAQMLKNGGGALSSTMPLSPDSSASPVLASIQPANTRCWV